MDKLEWMYKGPNNAVDTEEYLLGKAVTNTVSVTGVKNEVERDCLPTSLLSANNNLSTGSAIFEQVDVARKVHEDPLFAIKKKEIERREQLLKNPVKLKKLHDMLKNQRNKETEMIKAKSDKKKKKKKKKKREKSDSDDSCDDTIDLQLKKKLKKLKTKLKLNDIYNLSDDEVECNRKLVLYDKKRESNEYNDSTDDSDNEVKKNRKHQMGKCSKKYDDFENNYDDKTGKKRSSMNYDRRESLANEKRKRKIRNESVSSKGDSKRYIKSDSSIKKKSSNKSVTKDSYHSNSSSYSKSSSENDNHSDGENNLKRKYGLLLPGGKEKYTDEKNVSESRLKDMKDHRKESIEKKMKYVKPKPVKLSEVEKEQKRRDMMKNAEWRNELRDKNIKTYKKNDEKEKVQLEKGHLGDFYRKQLSYAASQSSVEGRIKSNINRIQRSASDMDKNFARR